MTILTAAEVRAAGRFESAFDGLWADVLAIADRVHDTADSERAWAWHHLLLAAANFKTHAKLFPPALPAAPRALTRPRADVLDVPTAGGSLALNAEDPATWRTLSAGVKRDSGCRVRLRCWRPCGPTGTRSSTGGQLSAAIGLTGSRCGWEGLPVEPDSTDRVVMSWQNYGWYRDTVLSLRNEDPIAAGRRGEGALQAGGGVSRDLLGRLWPADRGCYLRCAAI